MENVQGSVLQTFSRGSVFLGLYFPPPPFLLYSKTHTCSPPVIYCCLQNPGPQRAPCQSIKKHLPSPHIWCHWQSVTGLIPPRTFWWCTSSGHNLTGIWQHRLTTTEWIHVCWLGREKKTVYSKISMAASVWDTKDVAGSTVGSLACPHWSHANS